jgi:hypothetical protein
MTIKNPIPVNNILATLWIGTATISEYQEVTDPNTFQTTTKLVPVIQDEPCRLSYSALPITDIETGLPQVKQETTLFIRPDIIINPGSVIEITQRGRTNKYKQTAEPAIYTNHQEIKVSLDKEV